jgi:hypothetical protein
MASANVAGTWLQKLWQESGRKKTLLDFGSFYLHDSELGKKISYVALNSGRNVVRLCHESALASGQ